MSDTISNKKNKYLHIGRRVSMISRDNSISLINRNALPIVN